MGKLISKDEILTVQEELQYYIVNKTKISLEIIPRQRGIEAWQLNMDKIHKEARLEKRFNIRYRWKGYAGIYKWKIFKKL